MSGIKFRLPFDGFWLTFWGGNTLEQNHHHDTVSQKFAFDFIQTSDDGRFFKTSGSNNNDYYSFGQDILAPAEGTVFEVVDGLRDNKPGELNSFNFIGNYVMLKHGNNVYSILGHLRQYSVKVSPGDKVDSGQSIGQCGNSGYSTDPHLHFHVQNSDTFAKMDENYDRIDIAKGQKVIFGQVVRMSEAKQEIIKNYSPLKGDVVSN